MSVRARRIYVAVVAWALAAGCAVDGGVDGPGPAAPGAAAARAGDVRRDRAGADDFGASAEPIVAIPEPAAVAGKRSDIVPVDLVPTLPPPTRPRKRLNIDQLDAALRRATGDIGWTAGAGIKGANEFATLAITLGKPNYTDLTTEDLENSALFHKFLGDAAASACTKLVARELTQASADRVLITEVEPATTWEQDAKGVDANLSRLLLRYHGRVVAPDSPELETWRFLFRGATKITGKASEGWRAVCVALVTHPAFVTY